jgi:hypothetical protein
LYFYLFIPAKASDRYAFKDCKGRYLFLIFKGLREKVFGRGLL